MKFFERLYPVIFVGLEVSKAVATESLLLFCKDRQLPFPNALVTLFPEVLKAMISLFFLGRIPTLRYAYLFIAHSMLFFLNNALYILLLKYTSASTIQFWTHVKLPITALMHSWIIKSQRKIGPWISLFMIFIGVILTQLDSKFEIGSSLVLFVCGLLALNSATAAIYNELLLKSLNMSFWEQQSWISCLGTLWNSLYFILELESVENYQPLYSPYKAYFLANTFTVVTLGAYVGIIVGFLVKKFDTVIKLQSSAISTVVIGILSSLLFSKPINNPVMFFIGSLLIISFTTVYAKLSVQKSENQEYSNKNEMPKIRFMLGMIIILLVIGFITLFSIYSG